MIIVTCKFTQAILTSLLFWWEAEIRLQGGLDECAVEIGVRWESEGARLKAALYLLCQWDIIQVVQIFLVILLKQVINKYSAHSSRKSRDYGAVIHILKSLCQNSECTFFTISWMPFSSLYITRNWRYWTSPIFEIMQTCEWFELIISNLIELDNECMNYTAHWWMCLELLELVERVEG